MIPEKLHQQTDQQSTEGAHEQCKHPGIQAQDRGGPIPNQGSCLIGESDKNKGYDSADETHYSDQKHQAEIGSRFCLWVNHRDSPLSLAGVFTINFDV